MNRSQESFKRWLIPDLRKNIYKMSVPVLPKTNNGVMLKGYMKQHKNPPTGVKQSCLGMHQKEKQWH